MLVQRRVHVRLVPHRLVEQRLVGHRLTPWTWWSHGGGAGGAKDLVEPRWRSWWSQGWCLVAHMLPEYRPPWWSTGWWTTGKRGGAGGV